MFLTAQVDSTWQSSISTRLEVGLVPINKAKYTVKTAELSIKKMSLTLVPSISQKSIHNLGGFQFGTSVYKNFDWGYIDGTVQYSNSNIFPTLTIKGNAHLNLFQGFSATVGVSNYQYANGNNRSVISVGSTYYLGSWMSSYTLDRTDRFSHKIIARKYLTTANDYIQLGFYYGSFESVNILGTSNEVVSSTIQIGFNKTIWNDFQLQCSLSSVGTNSLDNPSRFTNYLIGIKKVF